jgi:hypothetical protein
MFRDLREFQHLVFRACVRHVMLFATFPCHVAQEMLRNGAWDAVPERRSHRVPQRYEDHRWLR